MARQPVTTMRLRDSEVSLLDAVAADMACSRTDAVRELVRKEAESRGLQGPNSAAFLRHLGLVYGRNASLRIELDGGAVVEATIAGRSGDDFQVELVHGREGRADLFLEDPASHAAVLVSGLIRSRAGLQLTIEIPIAYLTEGPAR